MSRRAELAAVQELFDEVREACSPGLWSQGVELARADKVHGEREDTDEVFFRVATRGGMISPGVALHIADCDWECDCPSRADACEHVAACVIALKRARQKGEALPQPSESSGRIRYAFSRTGGGLSFEREIVSGDKAVVLESTLDAIASGRVDGPPFVATPMDIAVESALGSRRRGTMPRESMNRLFETLREDSDVQLDGQPIRVSEEPVVPHGRVDDAPGGFIVSVGPDPSISEGFANGIVLCGDTLRRVGQSRLTGRELEDLPRGRFFSFEQAAELATEVLPSLRERIPLEINTKRLPRATTKELPRIAIRVERDGDSLSLLPTLVYGTPVCARIDSGRLVHLSGAVPVRDEAAERIRVRQLQSELGLTPGHRVVLADEEAVAMAARLANWNGEITGDAHHAFYQTAPLHASLQIDGTHVALHFETGLDTGPESGSGGQQRDGVADDATGETGSGSPRRASAESVLRAWREGHSLVPVSGGGFAPLPDDWLQRFGHRIADLLDARNDAGEVAPHALPELGRLCDDLDEPRPVALDGLAPLLDGFEGIPAAAPPDDLNATLRHYQEDGLDWLCFMREARLGALLADDMGLGKTLQALCAVKGRTLVVAPTSVMYNWSDEIEKRRPALSQALYHGPRRSLDPNVDVTLTSYAVLRLDSALLREVEWDCVVLDEAQAIKNPNSQVSRAAYGLRARFRMALTGTPVENHLEDLWSQFHFLNPGLLGTRREFQERVARPVAEGDPEAAVRLRERLKPFVLRRLKRDVAPELPPRTEVVLHVALSQSERDVYDAVRAASQRQVVEKLKAGGNMLVALEALLRMRQAACHAGLVPGQSAESSSKIDLLVDRISQAAEDGHKALVFSQWTSLLDRVEPKLREEEIDFVRLDGSTRDRGGVVERFQSDAGPPVMLISLRAGGTGLNLTAADHVFLLDPWWNPAVEDQAADRTHRIGQDKPVVVHRLVAADTVEERILALQASKRALSEAALGESAQAAGLSREDLLRLLED